MICIGLIIMFCQMPVAKPAPVINQAAFCRVAKPIYWVGGDTRTTKEQADEHNRVGKELCGWGKK